MDLNLDYKRKPADVEAFSNSELTSYYVNYAVNQNKEGFEGQKRRVWGRIQRKFDDAILDKKDTVDINQDELDFIREAFKSAKFPPELSMYVIILDEYLVDFRVPKTE